jgi:hypothetical protein
MPPRSFGFRVKPPERTLDQAAVLRVWIGWVALYQAKTFGKRGVPFDPRVGVSRATERLFWRRVRTTSN